MRPPDLPPAAALGATKPHGTRIRYIAGCRCVPCRAANSRYESGRLRARRNGDWNGLVPAARAKKHLRALTRVGVGRRSVAEASDVGETVIAEIRSGAKKQIRARTERRILSVTKDAVAGAACIPADRTWVLINRMLREGFTRGALAQRIGRKTPALQIGKRRVLARTAMEVERFYERIMEGA